MYILKSSRRNNQKFFYVRVLLFLAGFRLMNQSYLFHKSMQSSSSCKATPTPQHPSIHHLFSLFLFFSFYLPKDTLWYLQPFKKSYPDPILSFFFSFSLSLSLLISQLIIFPYMLFTPPKLLCWRYTQKNSKPNTHALKNIKTSHHPHHRYLFFFTYSSIYLYR